MNTKPTCAVRGLIPGRGMCGAIIVGGKLCGHSGECEHKRPAEPTASQSQQQELPSHLQWAGKGPAPASWFAPDGTKVYRSYADYVMD